MGKLVALTAGAAGYVLGARAGRERYDQISAQAQRLWRDPRVQQKKSEAEDLVKDKAPAAKENLANAAKHATNAASKSTTRS